MRVGVILSKGGSPFSKGSSFFKFKGSLNKGSLNRGLGGFVS